MRATAVVISPSIWHDVLPTVIIEALANGRPVLGTALGGIPYLIGIGTPEPGRLGGAGRPVGGPRRGASGRPRRRGSRSAPAARDRATSATFSPGRRAGAS